MLLNTVLFAFLATAAYASTYLEKKMHQFCEGNNLTSNNFQRAQVYWVGYTKCKSKLPQMGKLPDQLKAAALNRQNGTVEEVAREFCANADVIKFCKAKFSWATGLCGKVNEQNDISYAVMFNSRMVEYFCNVEDNTTILAKFVDEGAIECYNKSSKEFTGCFEILRRHEDMKDRYENMSKCVVESLQACSNATRSRVHNMFEYTRNISPMDQKAIYKNMTRWAEEQLKGHRTQDMLEYIPNGACKRAIFSVQYVAEIVLAAILSALPAILCNIQQHF